MRSLIYLLLYAYSYMLTLISLLLYAYSYMHIIFTKEELIDDGEMIIIVWKYCMEMMIIYWKEWKTKDK